MKIRLKIALNAVRLPKFESVFNTGLYTVLPENSILITANMQSETGFPSSHQLKSYVAYKCRLKLARALSCQRMLAFLYHRRRKVISSERATMGVCKNGALRTVTPLGPEIKPLVGVWG